jgi:DNA gyrase/topoisomerase IV subunit A
MSTDENNQVEETVTPETNGEEAQSETPESNPELEKLQAELRKRDETLGSLKRELKDLKKAKDEPKETSSKPEESDLLQKAFLRTADITAEDEVELALETSQKWDISVDKLVDDEDFQIKLEKLRTQKANEAATSNVKGGPGKGNAKETADYWIKKGTPPSRDDIPDAKQRRKISRAFLTANQGGGKTFYND